MSVDQQIRRTLDRMSVLNSIMQRMDSNIVIGYDEPPRRIDYAQRDEIVAEYHQVYKTWRSLQALAYDD